MEGLEILATKLTEIITQLEQAAPGFLEGLVAMRRLSFALNANVLTWFVIVSSVLVVGGTVLVIIYDWDDWQTVVGWVIFGVFITVLLIAGPILIDVSVRARVFEVAPEIYIIKSFL